MACAFALIANLNLTKLRRTCKSNYLVHPWNIDRISIYSAGTRLANLFMCCSSNKFGIVACNKKQFPTNEQVSTTVITDQLKEIPVSVRTLVVRVPVYVRYGCTRFPS